MLEPSPWRVRSRGDERVVTPPSCPVLPRSAPQGCSAGAAPLRRSLADWSRLRPLAASERPFA